LLVLQKIESSGLDGGGTLPGLCHNSFAPSPLFSFMNNKIRQKKYIVFLNTLGKNQHI